MIDSRNIFKKVINKNNWKFGVFFFLVVIFIVFSYSGSYFSDEHENLLQAKYYSQIYKDVFLNHMPLAPLLLVPFYKIFNGSLDIWQLRIITAVINASISFFIFIICFKITKKKGLSFIGPFIYLLWLDRFWGKLYLTEHLSSLFGLWALYVLIEYILFSNKKENNENLLWMKVGLLLGMGTTSRLNLAYIAPFIFIFYYIFDYINISKIEIKKVILNLLYYVSAFFVPIVLFLIYFFINGNLAAFFNYAFLFNIKINSGGIDWRKFFPFGDNSLMFFLLSSFLMFGMFLYFSRCEEKKLLKVLSVVYIYFVFSWLGCNPTGIGDQVFHAIPGLAGLVMINVIMMSLEIHDMQIFRSIVTIFIFILNIIFSVIPNYSSLKYTIFNNPGMSIEYKYADKIASDVSSMNKGDTFFILGHDPYIYYKANKLPCIKLSYPIGWPVAEIFHELELKKCNIIYLPPTDKEYRFMQFLEEPYSGDILEFITKYYKRTDYNDMYVNDDLSLESSRKPFFFFNNIDKLYNVKENLNLSCKDFLSNGIINYIDKHNWQEIVKSINPGINAADDIVIHVSMYCKNTIKSEGVRILFDGDGGSSHNNYWYSVYRLKEGDNEINLIKDNFSLGSGNIQWDKISNVQIGGYGEEPLTCQIDNFNIKTFSTLND